ncbi:PREDICTED: membrane cofactor protein-like [Thamnophis sirtalis]|uniref:Membrane cofactor protein-like n=1 Tax=Thamnophis sirtalis TaxID=35019 RepID=A0A6I9YCL0_9SAUR|nr:PREDICTED: membrane cofactor protein-like [Thamnophis sirtalis]
MGLSFCSNGVATVVLILLILPSTVLCDCSTPTLPKSSTLKDSEPLKDNYASGTVLRLVCRPGYEYISGSRPSMTCSADGTWTAIAELCQGKRCPVPHLENGRIAKSVDLRLGETITLECDYGFRLVGEANLRCILRGGTVQWHRDIPFCEEIPCVRPTIISNGRYDAATGDAYVVGTVVLYRCDAGYSLIGKGTITCVATADGNNGQWDSPSPECKKVSCPRPNIRNGRLGTVYKPNYTYDDRVTLECNPGYTLVGSSWVRCDADNTWKPSLPRCDKTVATTKGTTPLPPFRPVPPFVPPPYVPPPPSPVPPPIPPTLAPPVDETTFIPMFPTQKRTIPTVDPGSGSGSGNIFGIVFGIICALLVLAALIFAAVRWWRQREVNAPPTSQVASEKENTMGDRRPQKIRSKSSGTAQLFNSVELKTGTR